MEKGLRLHEIIGDLFLATNRYNENSQIIKRRDSILSIVAKELDKQISSATVDINHIERDPNLIIKR